MLNDTVPIYIPEAHMIIGIIFGCIAFVFRNDNRLKKFTISCTFYFGACILLVAATTVAHFYEFKERSLSTLTWILMSSLQSEFFTWSSLIMINPKHKANRVLQSLSISTVGFCLTMLIASVFSNKFFLYAIYIFQILFAYQIYRYIGIFRKEYKDKIIEVETAYDEDLEFKFKWIRSLFYSSISINILYLICSFFDNFDVYLFAISISPLFYLYCLYSHLTYLSKVDSYSIMSYHINMTSDNEKTEIASSFNPERIKSAIDQWVKNEGYLNSETTVDEIATEMGITRYDLTQYFSSVLKVQFRSWRIELRIQKAIDLIKENPAISTNDLCERSGYNDRNNFYKHFQRVTGKTLAKYREDVKNKTNY